MFKRKHTFMAVKTITVTEEAYKALASDKKKDESFSQVILRTHKKKGNVEDIMKFAGAWADMSDEEADDLKRNIGRLEKY
jgi:predicted CopG family antitoxin